MFRALIRAFAGAFVLCVAGAALADPAFDPALAAKTGADEHGMHAYVLVVLKTGPKKMAASPARDEMFKGHFVNIQRLADAGKLVVAGPFSKNGPADDWRGLFVFAVATIEEAQALVATDPVISNGEMVAEFHPWYATAALMLVPEQHKRVAKASF